MDLRSVSARSALWIWKAYLLVFTGHRIWSLAQKLSWSVHCELGDCYGLPHLPMLTSGAYLVLGAIGAVPILGFVLDRAILRVPLWRMWLAFTIAWSAYDLFVHADWFAQRASPSGLDPSLAMILGTAVAIPCWLAVYRYAFRSPQLWERTA
jgi:hypothetical protein